MAPGAMLDELLRIGAAIQLEAAGLIRVTKRTFIPEGFDPEMIEVFARGVRRYVETIDHNIRESVPERRRFERWVYPDHGISEKDWVAFRDMVHDRLQEVIEDLDTRFTLFARPDESKESVMSVGVGCIYTRMKLGTNNCSQVRWLIWTMPNRRRCRLGIRA